MIYPSRSISMQRRTSFEVIEGYITSFDDILRTILSFKHKVLTVWPSQTRRMVDLVKHTFQHLNNYNKRRKHDKQKTTFYTLQNTDKVQTQVHQQRQ
ncbi:hypothetical protein HanPI659440_Chr08g0298531 [Helianthus annuus]|nr:hypothetical protein HanPI659440_Chr08g0298531 [Helianthus annuus]